MAKVRYAGLDTLRGVTLVSMMAYHACWDLVYIFGMDWDWYGSFGAYLWQQSICWTFILLSGYCVQLGRHRLRPEREPSNLRLPVVTALGRHSMVVYLLHQPVIYGLLWVLFAFT